MGHNPEHEIIIINSTEFRCRAEAVIEMTRCLDDPRVLGPVLRRAATGRDGGALEHYKEVRSRAVAALREMRSAIHALTDPLLEHHGSPGSVSAPGDTEPHPAPGDETPES